MNKLFCFGFGYSAEFLADTLIKEGGWTIAGTTRTKDKRVAIREKNIEAFYFDADDDMPLADPLYMMRDTTHILISTPPSDVGDPSFETHAHEISKISSLKWVGYLSSTTIYGDRNGGWVDEESEVRPTSKRGSRRLRAEQQWLSLHRNHNIPVHIFRLAGIYGPNRNALDSVRAGSARRIIKPGHAFSRIHVADIAQSLRASMEKPNGGSIYNLADDLAAPSYEVITYACELLGKTPPDIIPFSDADLAPITLSFYADNKRIKNDKIKTELGVKLKYPTFRDGLDAQLKAEKDLAAKGLSATWQGINKTALQGYRE